MAVNRPRYYVGLATTFHDPALAVVGPDGDVLFAEATERYLQYKRAMNCEPDSAPRMAKLLGALVSADAEVVISTTWSERFASYLARSSATGRFDLTRVASLSNDFTSGLTRAGSERAFLGALHRQQAHAGLGTAIGLERAFGTIRIAELRRYEHHRTHAAFGAFGSPFEEATCLVVDGVGESGSVSLFRYSGGAICEEAQAFGTVTPGLFYALLTDVAGFDSMGGEEWKMMGLAPFGTADPALIELVRRLYRFDDSGRAVRAAPAEVSQVVSDLAERRPDDADTKGWADLARAAQDVFCELMDHLVREAYRIAPHQNLVLSGGCALNSAYSGGVVGRLGFRRLHVPSAPGDDGNALGAALLAWTHDHPDVAPSLGPRPLSPYLGSIMDTSTLEQMHRVEPRLVRLDGNAVHRAAQLLAEGKLVGWAQGRAEFGPRALGNRSILADPRDPSMKDIINAKVKYREAFRPFAPAILDECGDEWFEAYQPSPYMERTLVWRPEMRHHVPAVVHEDGTGRLQTVTECSNPQFYALLMAFQQLTGVPILLNTSLNVMGRPIVHSVDDALTLFYTTGLDALVIGDWLIA